MKSNFGPNNLSFNFQEEMNINEEFIYFEFLSKFHSSIDAT